MKEYKHLTSKDNFFVDNPLSNWTLNEYIAYKSKSRATGSRKTLEHSFAQEVNNILTSSKADERIKEALRKKLKPSNEGKEVFKKTFKKKKFVY